jgi:hypothetical protein
LIGIPEVVNPGASPAAVSASTTFVVAVADENADCTAVNLSTLKSSPTKDDAERLYSSILQIASLGRMLNSDNESADTYEQLFTSRLKYDIAYPSQGVVYDVATLFPNCGSSLEASNKTSD